MNKVLTFVGFTNRGSEIEFTYEAGGKKYHILVDSNSFHTDIPEILLNHYGLAMSLYMFNINDFDEIHLSKMFLTKEQIEFFEWYFLHGMAEFRYINGISPRKQIQIIPLGNEVNKPIERKISEDRYISMIGGGKDSIVGLELLKRLGVNTTFLGINTNLPSRNLLKELGEQDNLIDIQVKKVPDITEGFKFEGHKPGSSFWAFGSVIAAYVSSSNYVVVANEHSANYAQINHNGFPINHQFTKSLEFETRFNEYVEKYLLKKYRYFSIVRPLYEIQIAKIFSRIEKYHPIFISCNIAYKDGAWCKSCAKCAFVYVILAPFISQNQVSVIWGENLFKYESICEHIFNLASDNISPLECVGTPEETRLALSLSHSKELLNSAHPKFKSALIDLAKQVPQSSIENFLLAYNSSYIPNKLSSKTKDIIYELLDLPV